MRSNMTGVGYYSSELRNFNRGYARGTSRSFQRSQRHPSPQSPRENSDPFMEAGRLAVEYLISRGLLSPNVLSGKYQNGNSRNKLEESNDLHSSKDRDISRRFLVDQDQRSNSRERRRLGSSRSFTSDSARENEREGSLTEEPFATRAMEVNSDADIKDTTSKDTESTDVAQVSLPTEPSTNDDKHSEMQDVTGKNCAVDHLDLKTSFLVQSKDDEALVKPFDTTELKETKIDGDHGKEKDIVMDNLAILQEEEKSSDSSSKSNSLLISEENNVRTTGLDSLDTRNDNAMNDLKEIPNSKNHDMGVFSQSFEAEIMNHGCPIDKEKSIEPLSFRDETFPYREKTSGMPELGLLCSSISKERGQKRPSEDDDSMEGAKKAKQQWLSVAQSNEYSQLSDLCNKKSVSPAKNDVNVFDVSSNQESFTSVPLPLNSCVESNMNLEEKELLSNSFKICDLNLMEASDMHGNHEGTLLYSSISGPSRDILVDIDLSMRNNVANEYNASGTLGKDVEIIDLESASLEGCKSSNTSTKSAETGMTNIESFSNQQNAAENADVQDGYGFMISELLGHEVPHCSPVQPVMNTLHNDLGLNQTEGMFSEDDPIYMSLGEIPLTGLLRAWEQPTQERNLFEL